MRTPDSPSASFTTLTHARLRALQGDYAAAERLLCELLERQPDHAEARALLRSIAGRVPIEAANRIRRLENWLSRIRRSS